ncbi:hypothetical protein [Sphingosinicella sp. BN140058]|uniref:hypothetical protein n=1 Tax=Sphingosinicella sp. BN140058 TaxID=1892855 RepID=UPI0010127E5E|nr:hypothetical protein [Sphingosinicella sp. BN140058]QAY80142.1 hypothetical protein ETR14_26225 [Sphingosinicella sp. BN140058]
MSNVLIGIIGVILFIGLALAGALYLGPRFQESVNNSRASAAVQAVNQVGNAANMANTTNGTTVFAVQTSAATALQTAGFLKAVPVNPTGGAAIELISETGTQGAAVPARIVAMKLGNNAAEICEAIARQSGQTMPTSGPPTGTAVPTTTPSGCFQATGAVGTAIASGDHVAFARI